MPQNVGYFSYAWGLLKRDKGWPKVVLLLGLASLVPVVGWLGVAGYIYEWARLTAWGVDAAPKQSGVQIGECIKSGWRAFVATVGWMVVWGILTWIVGLVPVLGALVILVATVFVDIFYAACAIRAEIYQDFTAGYQINRIYDMIKRDFKGFAKVAGINLLMSLVLSVVMTLIAMIALAGVGVSLAEAFSYTTSHHSAQAAANAFGALMLIIVIITMVALFFGSWMRCITANMTALWMRQFNVPAWSASADPLPGFPTLSTGGSYVVPQTAPQQQSQYGYGQPQQAAPQQQPMGYQQPYAQPQAQQPQPYQYQQPQPGIYQQPVSYQPQPAPQQGGQQYQQPAPQPAPAPTTPQQAAAPASGYPVAAPAPQAAPAAAPAPAQPSQPAPTPQAVAPQPAAPQAAPAPQPTVAPTQVAPMPQPAAPASAAPAAPAAPAPEQHADEPVPGQAAPSAPDAAQGDSTNGTPQQ